MARFALVGPSYPSQSILADCQRTVNWYPEVIESQQGKTAMALFPTEGLETFCKFAGYGLGNYGDGIYGESSNQAATRGQLYTNGRYFVVVGNSLFEVFADRTFARRGTALENDHLPVSMAASNPAGNPGQLAICSGGKFYVLNLSTNALTQIEQSKFDGYPVSQVGYSSGFFVVTTRDTNAWYVSSALDATDWPNAARISDFPDNIVSMIVDHKETWFLGDRHLEVWYVSGNPLFPMDALGGGFAEVGSAATYAITRLDNSIFWIARDERGQAIAVRAEGYTPRRISNHAIEHVWQEYARIDDAVSFGYQQGGHSYWVICFPSADATWVFDAATGMWHERTFTDASSAPPTEHAHRGWNHQFAFGKHLVGDRLSGTLYEMAPAVLQADGTAYSFATDFGNPIVRRRRAPHISAEQKRIFHKQLQIDVETGLCPVPAFQGNLPPITFPLQDVSGIVYMVGMDDDGKFTTDAQPDWPNDVDVIDVYLNDAENEHSYKLIVDEDGHVAPSPVEFDEGYPQTRQMVSFGGQALWNFGIETIDSENARISITEGGRVYRGGLLQLRWSDDGGRMWTNGMELDCGKSGETQKRVIARRLGCSRDRVYEITTSDPVPIRVLDAYLDASPGYGPGERMIKEMSKRA